MFTSIHYRLTWLLAVTIVSSLCGDGSWADAPILATPREPQPEIRFLSPQGNDLPNDYLPQPNSPMFFIIHGFRASGTDEPFLRLAAAAGRRFPDANVVIVDWRICSPPLMKGPRRVWRPLRETAAQYQQSVRAASCVGSSIVGWMKQKGVTPGATVLCGHSLGAQIAAFASQECVRDDQFGQRVQAILAADPAGPLFSGRPLENRLDAEDADEVIVIHTTGTFGDYNSVGTLDIYVEWPDPSSPDLISRHSQARELLTESFLQADMSTADGRPFGVNALGRHVDAAGPVRYRFDTTLASRTELSAGD